MSHVQANQTMCGVVTVCNIVWSLKPRTIRRTTALSGRLDTSSRRYLAVLVKRERLKHGDEAEPLLLAMGENLQADRKCVCRWVQHLLEIELVLLQRQSSHSALREVVLHFIS